MVPPLLLLWGIAMVGWESTATGTSLATGHNIVLALQAGRVPAATHDTAQPHSTTAQGHASHGECGTSALTPSPVPCRC